MSRRYSYASTGIELDVAADIARIVALAEDVAIDRGAAVAAAMFHLAAIRTVCTGKAFGANASVQCVAAALQDRKGGEGYQAAHRLPGTITVNGTYVWDVIQPTSSALIRLQQQTMLAFAETQVLPAALNRADSSAEGLVRASGATGLKRLFGAQVQTLWSSPRFQFTQPLVVDRPLVLEVLGGWFAQISKTYQTAALQKRQSASRETDATTKKRRELEATVLETYADSFTVVNVARFVEKEIAAIARRYE